MYDANPARLLRTPTLAIAATLALAACTNGLTTPTATVETASTAAAAGAPELGSFGIDLTARDETVAAGDNFFFVCQRYLG